MRKIIVWTICFSYLSGMMLGAVPGFAKVVNAPIAGCAIEQSSLKFGDINGDEKVDSVDASVILQYAAYVGAGYEATMNEFLAQELGIRIDAPGQAQQSPIFVDKNNVFHADISLFGKSRSEVSSKLGITVPTPQDFPWWGVSLKNSDIVYCGVRLCLMFQYDKLVMIIYDTMTPLDTTVWSAAVSEYSDSKINSSQHTISFSDGSYLEFVDDFYAETGEDCYHQRFVSSQMIQ